MSVYEPPKAKKWQKAERWKVGLWDNRYPLCGLRLLWIIVGTKHVQMSAPICCPPLSPMLVSAYTERHTREIGLWDMKRI